jgi:hypothetical protein
MKPSTAVLFFLVPLLACPQTAINLKPPAGNGGAVTLTPIIERISLASSLASVDGSTVTTPVTVPTDPTIPMTYTLTKQPAPGQIIHASLRMGFGIGTLVWDQIPNATQTATQQRTMQISLPGGPYAVEQIVVITYVTAQ